MQRTSQEIILVHDYLTQRGGAERVAFLLTRAFPAAPLHTSLYDPASTFDEFERIDVRTLWLNQLAPLRKHHRLALPFLASAFSSLRLRADVVLCSSSGWAHGATVIDGHKVVYCHTPARWLYQTERYLRGRRAPLQGAVRKLRTPLQRWDLRAAATADVYLANSTAVAKRIADIYGREAEVLPPPPAVTPAGETTSVEGLEAGFFLCVSRLLPYKNVDAIVAAFRRLPGYQLVVAGEGLEEGTLRRSAPANVYLTGRVTDAQLRWLYANCIGLVAASHEDFGLTPLEAASFGKPAIALRWGGFLDTISEGETGIFFDVPTPESIAEGIRQAVHHSWAPATIRASADRFGEDRFLERIRTIVRAI
jgi:glycosyltransferase involved in cell wall biosynthesis